MYNGGWADMAFALGQRDGFLTAGNMIPGFFFEPFGLDVPSQDELPKLWSEGGWDKEAFYELDPDVFLVDAEYLHGVGWDDAWDETDTEEIAENVAPFFGNNMRRRREFHDRCIADDERARRVAEGQRLLLEQMNSDVVRAYADSLEVEE